MLTTKTLNLVESLSKMASQMLTLSREYEIIGNFKVSMELEESAYDIVMDIRELVNKF